jgi:sugar-specific transcriptional regulator TrmB
MKEEILKSLGLSDKEIKIYLANLQLGSSLVQKIANFAGLNRTSAYDLLKSLEQKGFVSHTIQSGKRFYQAAQPTKLIDMLKEREANILNESKSFLCIASKIHLVKLFKYYFPHFVKRRIKKRIKVKIICESQPIDKKASYKLLKQKIKTATWIYNNKIAMISLEKEPIGILINEKNFYETHKMMFDLLWDNL